MQTTIHVKTDVKTRDAAKQVAEEFGFSLTSLINALLKQVARSRRLDLSLDEIPNERTVALMKEAEEDFKNGRVLSFASGKDALEYLDREIEHEKRAGH